MAPERGCTFYWLAIATGFPRPLPLLAKELLKAQENSSHFAMTNKEHCDGAPHKYNKKGHGLSNILRQLPRSRKK